MGIFGGVFQIHRAGFIFKTAGVLRSVPFFGSDRRTFLKLSQSDPEGADCSGSPVATTIIHFSNTQ